MGRQGYKGRDQVNVEMVDIIKDAANNYKAPQKHICKYCDRGFVKESTLLVHMCESKRRWVQKDEAHVRLGQQAYIIFFKETQPNSDKLKYADFVKSNYYNAFVKFGKFLVDYRVVNTKKYMNYIIKSKFKLDRWCTEKYYLDWLAGYLKTEHWEDALSRSLETVDKWSDEAGENILSKSYFIGCNPNKICQDIINGRISCWIIFNTDTGKDFLSKLNEEQIQLVYEYIDPDYWRQYFIKYNKESKIVKETLKEVGF